MSSQPATLQALPLDGIVAAVASREGHSPQTIRGLRKAVVVARVAARATWLALCAYRNPVRAARVAGRLLANMRDQTSVTPGRKELLMSRRCVRFSGRYYWDLYVPSFPSAGFDRGVAWELNHIDPIGRCADWQVAIISVTRRCSLACEHCAEADVLNRRDTLSVGDLHEIVRRLQARGVSQIFFSGGEPLQRFGDLLELAAAASAATDVWILTSGRGLTADRARRLQGAGVTGVSISLDHWDPGEHDRFRGAPGVFAGVAHAAEHAREAGLLVALSLCPTRSFVTEGNLRRYAETARSLGATFIQVLEPKPAGRYAGRDVALEPAQQRLLETFSDRLNTAPADADHPTVRYVDWGARTYGCSGGNRYVYVDSDGHLHACPFCRAPGVRVLDRDFEAAVRPLQTAGCSSRSDAGALQTRTLVWTR